MKTKYFYILLFLTVIITNSAANGLSRVAVRGILDLRDIKKPDQFLINLNGEWEFYWNKFLRPFDFDGYKPTPDYYGEVPSYWTSYPKNDIKTNKYGYATYRLTILLPKNFRDRLGIHMPVFDSSYDIYINGKYIGGNGIPGKNANESIPEYRRHLFEVIPDSDVMTIIINVSNFHHRRGGFWLPVKLGTYKEAIKDLTNNLSTDWSCMSLLLGFSIFFLFFFILNPQEKLTGFLGMALTGVSLRPLFTSNFLILNYLNIDWTWIIRFEYFGLYTIIIGWAWFSFYLYRSILMIKVAWIITYIFAIATFLTIFFPVKVFSYSVLAFYPSMIFLSIYLIIKSFQGILNKHKLDILFFMAFMLLCIGGYHDIKVSLGQAANRGYILTNLIIIFVFIQAGLLLYKWVVSFRQNTILKNQLEVMNTNLEKIVKERTRELVTKNDEIQIQNGRIELQNKQLSDTIQVKNKIFSVIAHDLRSPVVNILYMLNLLKEKEYKENYDTFANSSIHYAQSVIGLLENMLVWGRDQENKIKFSPDKHDLTDIILTNLSIFKETADKKEITVNFTQVGSSVSFIDKDLLDIIIRNILSNAVKYTQRGGRISILLKDKSMMGEGILLKICDNGVGMNETKLKSIFTSSEIESTPGTEDERGTGFGLKLCHDLVKLNNGEIVVESKIGEGTCILINLPVE